MNTMQPKTPAWSRRRVSDGVCRALKSRTARWSSALLATGLMGLAPAAIGQSFPAELELSSLDGTNGFVLKGAAAVSWANHFVSGAGDVNGDGL